MSRDDDPEDPLPKLRAELDQMLMLAPEMARAARAWYDAYKSQDFTDAQALYLTAAQLLQNPGGAP